MYLENGGCRKASTVTGQSDLIRARAAVQNARLTRKATVAAPASESFSTMAWTSSSVSAGIGMMRCAVYTINTAPGLPM